VSGKRGARRWLKGHLADAWVREASARGYRSRAAFKLVQLDDAERLLRAGSVVVDLGAAPGGWSQVAAERAGARGTVLALDLLEMEPIRGVAVLRGDFTDPGTRREVRARLPQRGADLVMSDMAPNLSGVKEADQARATALGLEVIGFAHDTLAARGAMLLKIFQGASTQELVAEARRRFRRVDVKKPPASRARSAEAYLLGRDGIF